MEQSGEVLNEQSVLEVMEPILAARFGGDGVPAVIGWHAGNINHIVEIAYAGLRLGIRMAVHHRHFRYEKDIIKEVFAYALLCQAEDGLDDGKAGAIVGRLLSEPRGGEVAYPGGRRILHYDWSMRQAPYPFFIFQWVDGNALWNAPSETHFHDAGRALARLHCVRFQHFFDDVPAIGKRPRAWPDVLAAAFARALDEAQDALPPGLVQRLGRFDPAELRPTAPCLVHNDYSGANILVAARGGLCIIDWDNWVVDCPELDLVKMKHWTAIGPAGRLAHDAALYAAFLEGYAEQAGLIDDDRLAAYERLWLLRCFNFERHREAGAPADPPVGWRNAYPSAAYYREALNAI